MIIRAKWTNTGSYPNMSSGKVYTVLVADTQGVVINDDTGTMFLAPALQSPGFWQLVSATDIGPVTVT